MKKNSNRYELSVKTFHMPPRLAKILKESKNTKKSEDSEDKSTEYAKILDTLFCAVLDYAYENKSLYDLLYWVLYSYLHKEHILKRESKNNSRVMSLINYGARQEHLSSKLILIIKLQEELKMRVKEIDRPVPETFLDALGEGLERIAYAFLIGVNSKGKKKKEKDHPIYISDDVVGILIKYDYPGNIRELRNIIFYSVAKNETVYLIPKDIPDYIFDSRMKNKYSEIRKLKELNKYYILETLKYFNYNVTKTSKELGISRQTIYRILKNVIKDDVK